jgi:hypothetical protein
VHERTHLFFAISTVYRERGEDEKSFLYLKLANQTVRGAIAYDPAANDEGFRRLKTVFARHFLDSIAEAGFASELPVFIVGMPRSGTTLIEQIVASHPAVHGAGERKELGLFLNELGAGHGGEREFPDFVTDLEPGAFRELGERYVAALRPLAPDAERIVDKMPGNFVHVGLIAAALPDARVIHCLRDPLDTCLSCYEQYFQKAQPYCYDLEELGRFYRLYENLMEHWCAVLPGRILEVRYEDVVRDLEGEARRLIAFCGLDWSDACLAFHETERMVRTASANQVRQPLYATSVGRWRRFERELAPLIAALGI